MGNSGTALGIIGIILGAGAFGFAFFVWNGQNDLESDFNNLESTILVGIWEDLSRNTDYTPYSTNRFWLFEFGDNQVNNTEYFSVSNSNTRITIIKSGWYKIHLSALLGDINDGTAYSMKFYKNGDVYGYSSYLIGGGPFIYMDGTVFIECNAKDYIEISAYSAADDFIVYTIANYEHLTIEYVVL